MLWQSTPLQVQDHQVTWLPALCFQNWSLGVQEFEPIKAMSECTVGGRGAL